MKKKQKLPQTYNELTIAQKALYEFLKAHPGEYYKQYELANNICIESGPFQFFPYGNVLESYENRNAYATTQNRRQMSEDIKIINQCRGLQKVIVWSNKGIRLASAADKAKVDREYYAACRAVARAAMKRNKLEMDGQTRARVDTGRPVVEAYAEGITGWRERRKAAGLTQREVIEALAEKGIPYTRNALVECERYNCEPSPVVAGALLNLYEGALV